MDATINTDAFEQDADKAPRKKVPEVSIKLTDESAELQVGGVGEIEFTLLLKVLLSLHAVIFDPERVNVDVSAASNHTTHPGIVRGSNPQMFLDVPIITCLEQNIVGG